MGTCHLVELSLFLSDAENHLGGADDGSGVTGIALTTHVRSIPSRLIGLREMYLCLFHFAEHLEVVTITNEGRI